MPNDQMLTDNIALIERNRELECELASLKAKLGAVGRIADELHESAAELVERHGDGAMPANAANECSFKFWLACEIKDALR